MNELKSIFFHESRINLEIIDINKSDNVEKQEKQLQSSLAIKPKSAWDGIFLKQNSPDIKPNLWL